MAPAALIDESEVLPSFPRRAKVLASVLHGPRDLRLEERTIEDPAAGEVQVAIKSTGVSGSDVSYYTKLADTNGDLQVRMPLSLGHESSGVVVAVGPHVQGLQVGDRVALEVGVPCNNCTTCWKGRYNLCKQMRFRSSAQNVPHYQGTLQERINHPAQWCYKLPDYISFDSAALLEPLSVAIHAVNRAGLTAGSTALVIGAGTVGMLTAAVARHHGCSRVVITDVDHGRVDYALFKGFATHGRVAPRAPPPSETTTRQFDAAKSFAEELIEDLIEPADDENEGFDVSFECTGKEICMSTSMYAAKPGGKVVMVGMGTPIQTLPVSVAHLREIDIVGIFRYANTYEAGIQLLRSGVLPNLDDMVTHRFYGLESAPDAFALAHRTKDDDGNVVIKVVIDGL